MSEAKDTGSARTVVFAVDSFKGSIAADAAAAALAAGWSGVRPKDTLIHRPMADGGEGTVAGFAAAVPGATLMPVTVDGPEGVPVAAHWLLLPPTQDAPRGTGVVELAGTSGIELLGSPPRLRPFDADTRGFGQAIAAALDHGISRLVLGIGSSASTDAGVGMLAALGARILDADGAPVLPGARGLRDVAEVDVSTLAPLPPGGVRVLSDVTNPLTGPRGAAAVFGPQKGLGAADIPVVDASLARFAAIAGGDPDVPGAGAAGGTGFALRLWGGDLLAGAAEVAELIGLAAAVATAAVVITGEGSFDGQSADGKVPSRVQHLAAAAGVPAMLVAGRIAPDADTRAFAAAASLTDLAGSPEAAMADPARWLTRAGAILAASH
ncbi:glycerate kinase [Microbacterium sp. SSW1-59]|uniref:glycerate kinase n=1 Tax=Microbacterium xanthum TaxID=3079794 RepID=UPI002AD29784|nr:glycerate kinase [Microbacterium sp. SSW1-59]MDZ8201051.1 glycerate kinase [Microbacterium sp. SSW1-59]